MVFTSGGGDSGPGFGFVSPQQAQNTCRGNAARRLGVPLPSIGTYRGSDTGDGNYMINFRVQPPQRPNSSGFCIITKRGEVQRFEFDPGSGPGPGPGPGNGSDPHDAALRCKNGISAQWPNVPLAYINVEPPRITGGSLTSAFRVQPPGRPSSSGTCEVFKNGKTNIQYNR